MAQAKKKVWFDTILPVSTQYTGLRVLQVPITHQGKSKHILTVSFSVVQKREVVDDVSVYLLNSVQYMFWSLDCIRNNNSYLIPVDFERGSGRIHTSTLQFPVEKDQEFFVLIDNRHSSFTPKDVRLALVEEWEEAETQTRPESAFTKTEASLSRVESDKPAFDPKKVFIVHGHDATAKLELKELLCKYGLEPVILNDLPNESKTIIEKFEDGSSNVGYAFVLLTPDDVAAINWETHFCTSCNKTTLRFEPSSMQVACISCKQIDDSLTARARQNVVFEMGFFIGKLQRKRVCCLHTGKVTLPSDIQGVMYIPYQKSVKECLDNILTELRNAGYTLNMKKN